jgi:hypothetical protein
MTITTDDTISACAERVMHEVELDVAEHGNPRVVPHLQTDISTVARFALKVLPTQPDQT